MARIETVAADPGNRRLHVEPLAGGELFRLRVGDNRVLFSVDNAQDVMRVELIRTRGDVQKVIMSFALPKPKAVTEDEVVLSRADWDAIVRVLGEPEDEDQDDLEAVMAARADNARFSARVARKRDAAVDVEIPIEVVRAKLDGMHPLKAWRDHRGWTQVYLNFKSGVGRDLIAQIETRRKNGSVETLDRLARALDVPMEALIEDDR